jgi:integrase
MFTRAPRANLICKQPDRHTFGTLLKANGEDVKAVLELLRHANSRITLEVYTQAVTSRKRAAQSKVVRVMVPNLGETKDEVHS